MIECPVGIAVVVCGLAVIGALLLAFVVWTIGYLWFQARSLRGWMRKRGRP